MVWRILWKSALSTFAAARSNSAPFGCVMSSTSVSDPTLGKLRVVVLVDLLQYRFRRRQELLAQVACDVRHHVVETKICLCGSLRVITAVLVGDCTVPKWKVPRRQEM